MIKMIIVLGEYNLAFMIDEGHKNIQFCSLKLLDKVKIHTFFISTSQFQTSRLFVLASIRHFCLSHCTYSLSLQLQVSHQTAAAARMSRRSQNSQFQTIFLFSSLLQILHNNHCETRKHLLCGYIVGVLTLTTSWDQNWRGDETVK